MAQALGFHSKVVMTAEPAEEAQRKIRLFWALYALEKAVSLRLGRSSTIRDHDITVPRLLLDRKMTSLLHNRLPDWTDVASLYGRVYDNIYSPNALAQPASIRESRTRAVAAELERIMAARVEFYVSCSLPPFPCMSVDRKPKPDRYFHARANAVLRNGQISGLAMWHILGRVDLSYMPTELLSTPSWPPSIEGFRRGNLQAWRLVQNVSQLREPPLKRQKCASACSQTRRCGLPASTYGSTKSFC